MSSNVQVSFRLLIGSVLCVMILIVAIAMFREEWIPYLGYGLLILTGVALASAIIYAVFKIASSRRN